MGLTRQQCNLCHGSGQMMDGIDGYGLPKWRICPGCLGSGGHTAFEADPHPDSGAVRGTGSGDPVNTFSELVALIVAVAVGYASHAGFEHQLTWYWPVGIGFVVLVIVHRLLIGPLRSVAEGLLTMVKLVTILLVAGIALYFLYFFLTR